MESKFFKSILEFQLDEDFIVALVKAFVWVLSWVAGILIPFQNTLLDVGDAVGTSAIISGPTWGSTCLIFSFSLIIDILFNIKSKKSIAGRAYYSVLCVDLGTTIVVSFTIMFNEACKRSTYNLIIALTIITIVMIAIGFIISLINFVIVVKSQTNEEKSKPDLKQNTEQNKSIFEKNLESGTLGNIEEK